MTLFIALTGCTPTATTPPADDADVHIYGPAAIQKIADGYELKNRVLRLVIDENTGDAIYWGSADGKTNLLGPGGLAFSLDRSAATGSGHIEIRDDETVMFVSDTGAPVRWRKIYCLRHDSVAASTVIENSTDRLLDDRVVMHGRLAGVSGVAAEVPDTVMASSPLGELKLQAYTQSHELSADVPPGEVKLAADLRPLQPGERISFAMAWRIR